LVRKSTNILEPWVRQARSDTGNVSVSFMRPSFRRWNSNSNVISLDMEDGGTGTMPSFCQSTCPVAASSSRPCSALVSRAACAGGMAKADKDRAIRKSRRIHSLRCVCRLLIDHDMGVVAARPGHTGQFRVGILDRIERSGPHSIESL